MKQYHDLLYRILNEGDWQDNRTGIRALRIDGHMMQFNMKDGFPAVNTKKLAFNPVKGELCGFIRGYSSAADFRELGCKIWDQNANENQAWLNNPNRRGIDDLGRVYGVQWRDWQSYEFEEFDNPSDMSLFTVANKPVDQLKNAIDDLKHNPTSRRIIVNAWNPGELNEMALPPCHMMFQLLVNVRKNELSLLMYQRSCDTFLGIPFNIASYALLLHMIAKSVGMVPGKLTMFLADVHIYENHIEQVNEQLSREAFPLPQLLLHDIHKVGDGHKLTGIEYLDNITPRHIELLNYQHHPALKGAMAV